MKNEAARAVAAFKITWIGFFVNLVLSAFKLAAGVAGSSGAMVADAVHSMSDLATDAIVLLGFRYVSRPADKSHDYGHGKFETLASVLIGLMLAAVGVAILYSAVAKIASVSAGAALERPGPIALAAAVVSVVFKEILYRMTVSVGKKINSMAIIANAWHHRSDSFSSVAAALGIGGAMLGEGKWRLADPLAACVVAVLIVKVAYDISVSGTKELLDASLGDEEERRIIETARAVPGVENPHNIRTRKIGNNVAVEIHIEVSGDTSVAAAHELASAVEKKIGEMFDGETFVSVHIEPH